DGVWGPWSAWDLCSVSCARGQQKRHRSCIGPFYGGRNCTGQLFETQNCTEPECPEDGILTPWSPWGDCDVTCGGGVKERRRDCIGPFYGGRDCEQPLNERVTCNPNVCPGRCHRTI
ncbi:unnamed protein product, partial [Lymnaea stagnalis]